MVYLKSMGWKSVRVSKSKIFADIVHLRSVCTGNDLMDYKWPNMSLQLFTCCTTRPQLLMKWITCLIKSNTSTTGRRGTLMVCLNLEILKEKKKNRKVAFFSLFGLRKIKRKKTREEKCKKNLSCHEEQIFLPNMKEKWRKKLVLNRLSKMTNRLI